MFRKGFGFPVGWITLIVALLLAGVCFGQGEEKVPQASLATGQRFVSIDFNNVDIQVFIKFMSELTGKNFIIDERVKGKVTILSPGKISLPEAYRVFESVLEVHGFTAVEAGEVVKIVSFPDARSKNIETLTENTVGYPEDKIVTQLIPLKYADCMELKRLFAPLVSKGSVVLSYDPTNTLIITDYYSNVQRLLKIVDTVDVLGIGYEIAVIPIEFASAPKLEKILATIFQPERVKAPQANPQGQIRFIADERTNAIIALASENDVVRVRSLIKLLDREVPRGKEKINVYYLEHSNAEEMAKVLHEVPTTTGTTAPEGPHGAPIISKDVKITADKATNSLIIMAGKEDYEILKETIEKLDIPRSMVYIEVLIMEVNVGRELGLGTEWITVAEASHDGTQGGVGGGFSGRGDTGFENIGGLITPNAAGIGSLPPGFSVGVFSEAIKIGDVLFPNLAAVAQAFRKDKDVNILSTPQVLTTDNEEARISVGKNIPYLTKSGSSTVESYNTYEYKDVGIALTITPHISKDRNVRLTISQEVTKLDEFLTAMEARPTTLKRTIDTTVIVQDKNTVVLGGLIDDSLSETEYKVPCLGEIPGFKWLFKSISRSREKTNLLVFLTPHVVANPAEADKIYRDKKEHLQNLEEGQIKMYKRQIED